MIPGGEQVARFVTDLATLISEHEPIGLAVSGGPDSLALLLLAAAARPGRVEAATVDHGLRPESRQESDFVRGICERLGVRHASLTVKVQSGASLQAQARAARYHALGD